MTDNREYAREDVLKDAREAFAETVRLKLEQFYRFVPKGSNPALTGHFVEELVRGFIQKWLRHQRLFSGTLYSDEFAQAQKKGLQLDGIVYDPHLGPLILEEGGFAVVHPVFCTGVIEIKTSVCSLDEFGKRLNEVYELYMRHLTKNAVMGVVIADSEPVRHSRIEVNGQNRQRHDYWNGGSCPIFILFSEHDGIYKPHTPAIDALIRGIYRLHPGVRYL